MASEYKDEAEVLKDAYGMWSGGACNPVSVSSHLYEMIRFYGIMQDGGWDNVKKKPAILLVMDQLATLLGYSSSSDILAASKRVKEAIK